MPPVLIESTFLLFALIQNLHDTIMEVIQTGIACKKIATQFSGGLLLKKLKYFVDMLNSFEFSRLWGNEESWLIYENKFFELPNDVSRLTW